MGSLRELVIRRELMSSIQESIVTVRAFFGRRATEFLEAFFGKVPQGMASADQLPVPAQEIMEISPPLACTCLK